ncbi:MULTISPECIES: hypothetical protein [unclassified Rickettsia]|uniref:hypothetical protein n=1 Tax=unclassified Rickettsia TaxID=114295 RepID=UPI003132C8FC
MQESDKHYDDVLLDILVQISEQNKAVEAYLLQKNYEMALTELSQVNEKLAEYTGMVTLLIHIKNHYSDKEPN